MNDRLKSLQALRGVAVLLVVAFHLRHFAELWLSGFTVPGCLVHLQAGVDLFFVISGYVMVYVGLRVGRPPLGARQFLLRRALRILPLYWIFTLVAAASCLIVPGLAPVRAESWSSTLVGSLLLWPQASVPLVGQGWTLVHEMYFYLVFALLLAVAGRHLALGLAVWVALLAGGLACWGPFGNASPPLLRTIFHPLTFEFVAGAALALLHRAGYVPRPLLSLVAGIALWLGTLPHAELPQHGLARPLWYGTAAVLVVHGLVALERTRRVVPPAWLGAVGDASYSIYLSHLMVIFALGRAWLALVGAPSSLLDFCGLLTALGAAAVAAGFVVWWWLERPLQAAGSRVGRPVPSQRPATAEA